MSDSADRPAGPQGNPPPKTPPPGAVPPGTPPPGAVPQAYRGEAIGLPRAGRGALVSTGPRLLAFLVDAVASALVAALFVPHGSHRTGTFADRLPGTWSLLPLAVEYIFGMLVAGRTLGMYLFGLRVVRVTPGRPVDPLRAVVRTALLFLLVPAVVFDRDGRGLHDRFSDTAVVRA